MLFKRQLSGAKRSIAVQNSFPNGSHTAELEFIRRLRLCAERQSIDVRVAAWSSEVLASGSEFLLSLHEVSPKLTAIPTVGAMWNPPSGIRHDPTRCAFAASFDGYLSASPNVTQFIGELSAGAAGVPKPVADFRFFPSSPRGIAQASSHASLAYLGVHWDGARHGALLDGLARDGLISLYGPESAWRHVGSAYQGQIPFDGVSAIKRLAEHGIVLCLHREPHLAEDTPSMRLFEAASAGCLILSDSIPFAHATFGDSIFVLPDGEGRADFIRETLAWAKANPGRARDMARESRRIFEQHCSLDVLLPKIVAFGRSVAGRVIERPRLPRWPWRAERVDVFCVLDGSNDREADRAIAVVNAQTYRPIRLILVRADTESGAGPTVRPRSGITITTVATRTDPNDPGAVLARHVASPFIACLHPGVEWAPNHLATLAETLRGAPDAEVARAGRVLITRPGTFICAPNFSGDLHGRVREDRLLDSADAAVGARHRGEANPRDLMARSDWLMTRRALHHLEGGAAAIAANTVLPIIRTGYVTAFSEADAADKIEPIIFV